MGFHNGGYVTVWSVEEGKSGKTSRVRLSTSRKNKKTGQYEQDFSGFCTFIGDAHEKAYKLKERDRIKLLSCDVCNTYSKDTRTTFVDYKVFDFEPIDGFGGDTTTHTARKHSPLEEGDTGVEDDCPF